MAVFALVETWLPSFKPISGYAQQIGLRLLWEHFQPKHLKSFSRCLCFGLGKLSTLGAKFPISKAKCVKSKLHNEPSVQAISKKAVVKKLQKHYARPEGVPLQENGAEFKIEVSILKDLVTVVIDTSGSSLFKRGYRTEKGGAPIKEIWQPRFYFCQTGTQTNP